MANHEQFMHRCLQLASNGAGYVAPNPMVGSVLVYGDRIIGEGWHRVYGQVHAEVNCLNSVAEADKAFIPESILYVSLEPCAHFGKTPPCANRIVQEGIKHVVIATLDPFPEVDGRGIAILNQAGVKTEIGMLENECRFQNRRFFTYHEKKRPYIHLKWAQTADGFMGGKEGERLLITNPITNRLVHRWRSEEAAIMVGTRTAAMDNPQLTNRLWSGAQPVRVVVDAQLKLSKELNLFTDGNRTIVLYESRSVEEFRCVGTRTEALERLEGFRCVETRTEALETRTEALGTRTEALEGFRFVGTRTGAGGDVRENAVQFVKVPGLSKHEPKIICDALYSLNIQSVFIEGGAALLNSFLQEGFWDEAHILTNTALNSGGGLKAPDRPEGISKEISFNGTDSVEWMINK